MDLYATWAAVEKVGQLLLGPWAKLNSFINCHRQIVDRFRFRMITRQMNDSNGTWIDHIIHKAETYVIDVKAAYTNHNTE